MNPLLQVGSGSVEKSTGSGSGGPKISGSDRIRIRILIPELRTYLGLLLLIFFSFFNAHNFLIRSELNIICSDFNSCFERSDPVLLKSRQFTANFTFSVLRNYEIMIHA